MAENDILSVLQNSKLFLGVDAGELARLVTAAAPAEKDYAKNQIIINQGEPVNKIGILKKGSTISVKYHHDGNAQILRIYNQGEVFSLDAVNTSLSTSPATLISQTDCEVVFIPYSKLLDSETVSDQIKERIMSNAGEILSNELIRLMYKIDVLSKRTLRERIMTYLSLIMERNTGETFDIGMNQEQFAQYLCVNRSVLSKELNKMRKSGIIDYKGSRFTVY
jgi:CRP-like cAMP-binding protein